jgi:hypothetical protein
METKNLSLKAFQENYDIIDIYNWLTYRFFEKNLIPYSGTQLIFSPSKKYKLFYGYRKDMRKPDEIIIIDEFHSCKGIFSMKESPERRERLFIFVKMKTKHIFEEEFKFNQN